MAHQTSARTDTLRERLVANLPSNRTDGVGVARQDVTSVSTAGRQSTLLDRMAERGVEAVGGAVSRVAEQPFFESTEVPEITQAGPGDVQAFLRGEPTIQVSLGDATKSVANFAADLIVEPVKDVVALGETLIQASAEVASQIPKRPDLVARSLNPLNSVDQAQALMELGQETDFQLDIDPEQAEATMRGAGLVGGLAVAGPAGNLVRTVGSRALERATTNRIAQRVLPTLVEGASGFAEGAAFGSVYGALRPLSSENESRTNAVVHDAIAFGLFDVAIRGLGRGIGAIRRRAGGELDTRAAIREQMDFLRESFFNRGPEIPMPGEALTAEELTAQVVAGSTLQGATKTGFLGSLRRSAKAVEEMVTTRFPGARRIDRAAHTTAMQYLNADIGGMWFGRRSAELLTAGMSASEREIFGKALVESRLRQIKRDRMQLANMLQEEQIAERFVTGEITTATVNLNGKSFDAETLRRMAGRLQTEIMSTEERALVENGFFDQAFRDLQEVINPVLREFNTRNGNLSLVETDLPFVSLRPARRADVENGIPTTISRSDLDREAAEQMVLEGRVFGAGRAGVTAREVGATQAAFGQAPLYVTDPQEILSRSFRDALRAEYRNEFAARVTSAPWSQKIIREETTAGNFIRRTPEGNAPPTSIRFGEDEVPMVIREVRGNPTVLSKRYGMHATGADRPPTTEALKEGLDVVSREGLEATGAEVSETILGEYAVPKPVATMIDEVFGSVNRLDQLRVVNSQAVQKYMDFQVRLLLSSPVEAFAHSNRILSQLVAIPEIGDQGIMSRLANRFGVWFGPRLTGLNEMFNIYRNPEALRMEALIATKIPGGIPTRAFEEEFATRAVGQARQGRKVTALEEALEKGREFLFNLPEISRGLEGFDTRARTVAALTLRRITRRGAGREPTAAEYSEFLQSFGQYTDRINSNLVTFLTQNRVAPFARTQAGFIPGEIRRFFGNPGLPKSVREDLTGATMTRIRGETLWRNTVGTALMLSLTQKALVDRWPWENEDGHQMDLQLGFTEDGRAIYLPLGRILNPVLGRAARITTARAIVENLGDEEDIVSDAMIDLANTAITFAAGAPGISATSTLLTGSAPFITREGEILRLTPPEPTSMMQVKNRFLEAGGQMNPTVEAIFGVGFHNENVPVWIRAANAVSPGLEVGSRPILRESQEVREERSELFEISRERVTRALREHPQSFADRRQFYLEESKKFDSPQEQQAAFRSMLQQDVAVRRSRMRNFRRQTPFP